MIILEIESAIIRNLCERSLDKDQKLSEAYQFCDFDGVVFKFTIDKKGTIKIQMKLECAEAINEFGGEDVFERVYGSMKSEPQQDGKTNFNYAIQFNLESMDEAKQKEAITLAARLKANMMAAPFLWVAERVSKKENFAPFEIPYRASTGEKIYITPSEQGAAAVFSIRFNDPGDRVIGGVFFQELAAARSRVPSAPSVSYSNTAPTDLESFDIPEDIKNGSHYAFVTISMQSASLSERKRQETGYYVPMFRDYLHYHIKCAKAFMHQRMRNRISILLRVLDNAKPEPKKKVRRTVTGKILT